MNAHQCQKGDTVFNQGDQSHRAYVVVSGEIEILQTREGKNIPLARLGPGEIFGEMGLVEEAPRSATARASKETTLNSVDHDEFIEMLKNDPAAGLRYLHSIFERIRSMNARLSHEKIPEGAEIPKTSEVHCVVKPLTKAAKATIPEEGMMVTRLPFRVGRQSNSPAMSNDLVFDDSKPFQMSRNHFAIERNENHVIVRDRGSFLGTRVNDQKIGGHAQQNVAFLNIGDNEIVAGGPESVFRLSVRVSTKN